MEWSTMMFRILARTVQLGAAGILWKCFLFSSFSVNLFLFVAPLSDARKYCQDEYSTVKNSNETVLWRDYQLSDNSIVFSNPSCLNEDGTTVRRLCTKGTWIPESPPICDQISTNTLCPDEFYEYNGFCIIEYEKYTNKNTRSNSIGSLGSKNISICNESSEVKRSSEATNCCYMVRSGKWEKGMHCNASRYAILSNDHRFHLCPEHCVQSELGKEKCFCKVLGQTGSELAKVDTTMRKKLIAKLAGEDICRVGDDIAPQGFNYSTVITHNFYGSINFNSSCSIIEMEALKKSSYPKPNMVLNFDQKRRNLFLVIDNPEGLSSSKQYPLTCFTNAGFDPLRTARISRIKMKKESKHFEVYEVKLEKYIGEYYCEAYALNLVKQKSNVVLAYKEKSGNEYALRLGMRSLEDHFDTNQGEVRRDTFQKKLSSLIHDLVDAEVRFMRIYRLKAERADVLLHLTFKKSREISKEFAVVQRKLLELPDYIYVLDLSPVEFCLPETTDIEETLNSPMHWDLTEIWERRIPRQLCFQADGIPVSRVCEGNFISGASWSEPTGKCSDNMKVPNLTKFLHESIYMNISNDLVNKVTSITYNKPLSYLDIYFYTELIKKVNVEKDENLGVINDVFNIINNLSKENKSSLSSSQILFNATDTLLLLLDYQSSNKQTEDESFVFSADNILIRSVYPFKNNITGIYLTGNSNSSLDDLKLHYLRRNETFHDITLGPNEELDLAVSVPEEVLNSIQEDAVDVKEIQIVFTIFYEDSLFLSNQQKAASKVVSVTIPGYGTYLEEPIPILMRSAAGAGNCGFWDLGQGLQRKRGEWSSFGGAYAGNFLNNSELHICNFSHLTHFALLIVSEPIRVEEGFEEVTEFLFDEDDTNYYLNIITIIGGVLSALGILGIYVTAMVFSQWREKDGTKILLNLSTAILLEILFLQFSGASDLGSESQCKLIGCLLHYTLLSKFCWMLIYALLQYRRFVKVFGVAPKHLILKSMFFGWGFAIVPVFLTLLFSPDGYSKSTICYVHGLSLYTAVIFPVSIVIISNLIVFIIVMYNVTTKKVESTVETKFSILQLYLAVLLFSVLGIPWLFAIFAEFVKESTFKRILMYLFCITGTLQGFILFIFYVVINEETRERWKKYLTKSY